MHIKLGNQYAKPTKQDAKVGTKRKKKVKTNQSLFLAHASHALAITNNLMTFWDIKRLVVGLLDKWPLHTTTNYNFKMMVGQANWQLLYRYHFF